MKTFKSEIEFRDYIYDLDGRLYLVGGAVRDIVMGLTPKDKDYAVEGLTELPFNKVGKDFPVYLVEIDGEMCEVALCRTERKTGFGYNGFDIRASADVSIKDDLKRRDFTMNAMALDLHSYTLIDPFNGQDHIKRNLIVHTSAAFKEDPLRVLRAARFAARFNMKIAQKTIVEMQWVASELEFLPGERVGVELHKMFNQCAPEKRRLFFDLLLESHALYVAFPEIADLIVPDKHDGTTYNHVMNLLEHASDWTEFMMLLAHDLGKGATDPDKHPSHHGHETLGVPIAEALGRRLSVGKKLTGLMMAASKEHMRVKRFTELRPSKQIRFVDQYGEDDALKLMNMSLKDSVYRDGVDASKERDAFYGNYIHMFQARDAIKAVNGKDLIFEGVEPGPHFGQQLEQRRISALKQIRK